MQVKVLPVFLLLSSSLLLSTVVCYPNHHHHHNNDFPWQTILASLGITFENQSSVISSTKAYEDATAINKEHYVSESTVEILKSETADGIGNPIVVQNGTYGDTTSSSEGLATGYVVGIPIFSIAIFILFWYFVCKYCCACCRQQSQNVVVMQSQQPAAAPQIILQQPIVNNQTVAPPVYDAPQRWAQPPPQWNPPPQGPPQWAPHPMGQQPHYSPNSGYDNAAFATAPPPYNTGKY